MGNLLIFRGVNLVVFPHTRNTESHSQFNRNIASQISVIYW